MKIYRYILTLLLAAALWWPAGALASDVDWVVSASEAKKLIENDSAQVLDTRGESTWKRAHVPKSSPIGWRDFSKSGNIEGGELLASDRVLTERLQTLGVSQSKPVLVAGNPPDNWGEDGRIVWMLRSLGHDKAALVDGGVDALKSAGVELTSKRADVERGDFEVTRTSRWTADRAQVKDAIGSDVRLLDTREAREYRGKTPYGEKRGGHVPGAEHLHYTDLMDSDGELLPHGDLLARLREANITPGSGVITYCTGGVRSAWLAVVLIDLGFDDVKNYAGSMWEWSAAPASAYPLEKD
ncbi:MAG: sulfurtransferase [Myxococcota bacterium]